MSRSSRHLISILLLFLIFLAGCGADKNVSPNDNSKLKAVDYKPMGKAIYAPVEISYAVDNPIEIIEISVSDGTEHNWNYFQISGLVDQGVEESINRAIKSLFDQMLLYATGEELAPYRGIRSVVHPDKKINRSYISVTPQFNCNNVLSVAAYVSGEYDRLSSGTLHFTIIESLNFDLNTGKEFRLQDVFANDVNGLETVNDAIINELNRRMLTPDIDYDIYSRFTLAAPFKGISHDQKFYLSHDGINVIIDHNNPEFNLGFSNTIVIVPFNTPHGHVAILERFYDATHHIFTNEPFSKRFLRNFHVNTSHDRRPYFENGKEWGYVSIRYPEDLPQALIEIIDVIRSHEEDQISLLAQQSAVLFVEHYISAERIGPYVNISSNINCYRTNESLWQESSHVFLESGQSIRLEDIFTEGYDYKTVIRDAADKYGREYGLVQGPDNGVLLEDLMFKLNDTSINFVTKPFQWSSGDRHPFHFHITFEEIGYKNLNIFKN